MKKIELEATLQRLRLEIFNLHRRLKAAETGKYVVDPPWFADLVAAAHRSWLDSGAGQPINFHAIVRAVLACHAKMSRSLPR